MSNDKNKYLILKIKDPSFIIAIISLLISLCTFFLTWFSPARAEISIINDVIICQNFSNGIYVEINGNFINEGKRDTKIESIEIKYTFVYPYFNIIKSGPASIYEINKLLLPTKELAEFRILDRIYYTDHEFDLNPEYLNSITIYVIHDDGKGDISNNRKFENVITLIH